MVLDILGSTNSRQIHDPIRPTATPRTKVIKGSVLRPTNQPVTKEIAEAMSANNVSIPPEYSIEAMQKDLDAYLVSYNAEHPHQGRGVKGKMPADVFVRCLPKLRTPREEKMKKAA